MNNVIKHFWVAGGLLATFALWTVALGFVDVQAVGPQGSSVGFATVNGFVHDLTGVHVTLYTVTDWLGLVPIGFCVGFAVLGLVQWISRKRLTGVDIDLFILGGFYTVVAAAYLFFESVTVNFRPVLINGCLETSYPSSTTLLVLCVMPTAIQQLRGRIPNASCRRWVCRVLWAFVAFMVVGRLISGVHWLSDIVGGVLLSIGLLELYRGAVLLQKT